ncbi:MAG: hypothetical protein HC869_17385 [Rhodospirillales bacterium]|nr:hypothetical protein [Rhodospirillales bacterium]
MIAIDGLPAVEAGPAWHLVTRMSDLWRQVNNFRAALSLLHNINAALAPMDGLIVEANRALAHHRTGERLGQLLDQKGMIVHWREIPIRDAALTVFHCGRILESIKSGFGDCPAFRAEVEHKKLKAARKMFETHFGDYEQIRHAIAHAGEVAYTREDAKKNAFSGNHSSVGIKMTRVRDVRLTAVRGDCLIITHQATAHSSHGKIFQMCLTPDSLLKLVQVANTTYSAFDKAAEVLMEKAFPTKRG